MDIQNNIYKEIGLYLLKRVRVTLSNDNIFDGELEKIFGETEELQINSVNYKLIDIKDIELIGRISDYHTYKGFGEIEGIPFLLKDVCNNKDKNIILYSEFDCVATCHLELKNGKISAKDIKLTSITHQIYEKGLIGENYLYKLNNNLVYIGKLLTCNETSIELLLFDVRMVNLDIKSIVDIIKLPLVNDYVYLVLKSNNENKEVEGIVSQITGESLVLINDSTLIINLSDIDVIRFRGIVELKPFNNKSHNIYVYINEKAVSYLCKIPYLRDFNDYKVAHNGSLVSFIPGVSKRGLIAKDVVLIDKDRTNMKSMSTEIEENVENGNGKGIIIVYKADGFGNKFGYIGKEYFSSAYALMKKCNKPKGNIVFTEDSIKGFSYKFNTIFVVNYFIENSNNDNDTPLGTEKKATLVTLEESFPVEEYAYIKIDKNGNVEKLPFSVLYLERFVNDIIELTINTGEVIKGYLESCSEVKVFVIKCVNQTRETVSIEIKSILKVRYCGSVSSYRTNGTGHINGSYWFHVNNLRNPREAEFITVGAKVEFTLIATKKRSNNEGTYSSATDITIINEFLQHGLLVNFDGVSCQVIDNENDDNIKIYTLVDTRHEIIEQLSNLSFILFNYPITYYLRMNKIDTSITITSVEIHSLKHYKYFYGYIVNFVGGYGFIAEENGINEEFIKNWRVGTIYFKKNEILNFNEFGTLDTHSNYYKVRYSLNGFRQGKNITILKKIRRDKVYEDDLSVNEEELKEEKVDLNLYKYSGIKHFEGADVQFGLLIYKGVNNALINDIYINPVFKKKDNNSEAHSKTRFDPKVTNFVFDNSFVSDYNIDTTTSVYLVRYVPSGTFMNETTKKEQSATPFNFSIPLFSSIPTMGAVMDEIPIKEQPTIDYKYPVEILQEYVKRSYYQIAIHEESIQLIRLYKNVAINEDDVLMPNFIENEDIILQMTDLSFKHFVYKSDDDTSFTDVDGLVIEKFSVSRFYRFGVITDFNIENSLIVINNFIRIPLSLVDITVINILKHMGKNRSLHIIYVCEENRIINIIKITDNIGDLIMWDEGMVTDSDGNNRRITINNNAFHYISVLSDGMINNSFKKDDLKGKTVYAKIVNQTFFSKDNNGFEIAKSAIIIRLKEETATIQYDAGRDLYLGFRNPTFNYSLKGDSNFLKSYVGKTAGVEFYISKDGVDLEAKLKDDKSVNGSENEYNYSEIETDENETTAIGDLIKEKIVSFFMNTVDLRQLYLKNVNLDSYGLPNNLEQAQKAFDILANKRTKLNEDSAKIAAIVIALKFPDIKIVNPRTNTYFSEQDKITGAIEKIFFDGMWKKCVRIGKDSNSVLGEQAYYVTLLLKYPRRVNISTFYHKYKKIRSRDYHRFQLFLQDFGSREELSNFLSIPLYNFSEVYNLENLLTRPCKNINELISHLIMLDRSNSELVCNLLEKNNTVLVSDLKALAAQLDSSVKDFKLFEIVDGLRQKYLRYKKRFTEQLELLLKERLVSSELSNLLADMQVRFLRLICNEDRERFERISQICLYINTYTNLTGFSNQEESLKKSYHELCSLEEEIKQHPCKESVEILLMTLDNGTGSNIFDKLKNEITDQLNALYQAPSSMPRITCFPNEVILDIKQTKFLMVVINGTEDLKIQPADNITISLMSYVEGVSVTPFIPINEKLIAGQQTDVPVDIVVEDIKNTKPVSVGWEVKYNYSYLFSGETKKRQEKVSGFFEIQFGAKTSLDKNKEYENPYVEPARGQPLEDEKMFFGRQEERNTILSNILRDVDGVKKFIPGSAVIIHGQKKSGKTSLVYQIKNYIKSDLHLKQKAIILNFNNILDEVGGIALLPFFKRSFYDCILSRFEDEIYLNHRDVVELLKQNGVEIPDLLNSSNEQTWVADFDRFFRRFFRIDNSKHVIVLFMDEFTLLCTAIIKEIERVQDSKMLDLQQL